MHYPDERIRDQEDTLTNALLAILRDAPHIDYDRSLSWEGKLVILHSSFYSPDCRVGISRPTTVLHYMCLASYLLC